MATLQAGGLPVVGSLQLLIQYICSYPPYLESVSSIRNLRTSHAVVTREPLNFTFILQVKAKSSKWHRNLQLKTPIILGTVPLTSYQPSVIPTGEKPPGEVNGETPNVPAGTGGATIGYNVQPSVGPPPIGEPQAPGSTGWNMAPSDPNAQSQGVPYVQPNIAPQGPAPAPSLYPDLCKYVRISEDISSPS
jgi:hypothetical protein